MNEGLEGLRHIAVFAAVVEAQSFSEAARRLGLAKSAVSKQIAELEQNLGARLINRTTRKLNLTEAGQRYHLSCVRILKEATDAVHAVQDLQSKPKGTLRLNASTFFGARFVMPELARFMQAFPEVEMEVELIDEYVDLIEDNVDLAIRVGSLEDSSLVARKLASVCQYLVAAPSLIERCGSPSSAEDLERLPWIIYTHHHTPTKLELSHGGQSVSIRMSGRARTNDGSAMLSLTREGAGVCMIPEFFVNEDLRSGRLVRLVPDWTVGRDTAVYAVYPHSRHVQAKVRMFVDFLVDAFQSPPWSDACRPAESESGED
ncbi:MAG: LysR family transcriptional regulator [Myxococcota bacterium]